MLVGQIFLWNDSFVSHTYLQAHFRWGRDGRKDEGSEHYMEGVQVNTPCSLTKPSCSLFRITLS
jgi:hypothetical protein